VLLINSGGLLKQVGVMHISGNILVQAILYSLGVALMICAAQLLNALFVLEDKNYRHHVFQQVFMLLSAPGAGLSILQDVL
jgi:hypothetical protein